MNRSAFAPALSRHSSRTLAIVGGGAFLLAAGLFGGTFAFAHGGPPAAGVIHTCVNNSSGTFKVVAADATCKNNETAMDWNAQGIPGANGANGTNGAPGADGAAGAAGADGVSGYERVRVDVPFVNVGPTFAVGGVAECPLGKKIIGGGSQMSNERFLTLESYPVDALVGFPDRWSARHINTNTALSGDGSAESGLLTVYAICADVAP